MDMNEIVGTVSAILAVAGVLLNNRKFRVCFIFWIVSNIMSACIHTYAGILSLAVRDLVFFVLAIEGWIKWGRG